MTREIARLKDKRKYEKLAKELGYSSECIKKLYSCKTITQCENVLIDARNGRI